LPVNKIILGNNLFDFSSEMEVMKMNDIIAVGIIMKNSDEELCMTCFS
jgi:hypothetical protein